MKVTEQLIDKLANLARLEFSAEEKAGLKNDLQRMISFVEKLNEVDTTGVEPLLYMSASENVLREDEIKDQLMQQKALMNAENKNDQFFKVPKVIKN